MNENHEERKLEKFYKVMCKNESWLAKAARSKKKKHLKFQICTLIVNI